jgi:hypothetical protein
MTPPELAGRIVYTISSVYGDIRGAPPELVLAVLASTSCGWRFAGRLLGDWGCGTGMLSTAAALLGARCWSA